MRKHCLPFRQWVVVLLAWVTFACSDHPDDESFGLDNVVAMEIPTEKLSVMKTGAYTKSAVWASVWLNGEPYRARVNYAGATSVDDLKRSYAVELDRPFRGRTSYRLNAMNRDPSAMHALLSRYAFTLGGFDMPGLEPIAVWLNGDYIGLFLLQELYDEPYFSMRSITPIHEYQAEAGMASLASDSDLDLSFSIKWGTESIADLQLLVTTIASGTANALGKQADLNNVMRYMAVSQFIDNSDGINNNYYLVRTKSNSRFQMLPWDLDYPRFRAAA